MPGCVALRYTKRNDDVTGARADPSSMLYVDRKSRNYHVDWLYRDARTRDLTDTSRDVTRQDHSVVTRTLPDISVRCSRIRILVFFQISKT